MPGRPAGHAATVGLGSDDVELVVGATRGFLRWTSDDWRIGVAPEGSAAASVMILTGAAFGATVEVRRALRSFLHHFDQLVPGEAILTLDRGGLLPDTGAETATFSALCTLLRRRPDLRDRLGSRERATRLAADLAPGARPAVPERVGARRRTLEILTAMRLLRLVHPIDGRPLPGDVLPERDDAVRLVRARLAANPWAAGVHVSDADVGEALDHDYYDVDPWPFGALTLP
ncbi:MAG: hypothetical protein JWO68_2722 [Actinomycetia bacterium]|nr:hypothetical protein [Actinomycetes bacterium]